MRGSIRWSVTFALTVALLLTVLTVGLVQWEIGRARMLPSSPGQDAAEDHVHLIGCGWPSEHGEFFDLGARVDDLVPGEPSLAIMVVDAWGKASAVWVVDDQVYGADLSRSQDLPAQDVDRIGPAWDVSKLNAARIESSTVTALRRLFASVLVRARPPTTEIEYSVFDGATYQFRVSGWLCAETTSPPPGTEAWHLVRLHAALAAHSRLVGEAEVGSSNEALRTLASAPLDVPGRDIDLGD